MVWVRSCVASLPIYHEYSSQLEEGYATSGVVYAWLGVIRDYRINSYRIEMLCHFSDNDRTLFPANYCD